MDLMSNETKQTLFSEFQEMSPDELQKEIQSIIYSRKVYLENQLFDSSVFCFLDEVYEIIRDVLVFHRLSEQEA